MSIAAGRNKGEVLRSVFASGNALDIPAPRRLRVMCSFIYLSSVFPERTGQWLASRNELLLSFCPNPHCHCEWSLAEVIVAALPLLTRTFAE